MKDFIEKWNSDSKFKIKVKLSLYTLFIVFVAIFAASNRSNIEINETKIPNKEESNNSNNIENNTDVDNKLIIDLPNKYNYKINIEINEKKYQYIGNKNSIRETITKKTDDASINYIYENNNYYKEIDNENYVLTTKDEVYDIVEQNYLDLETINAYLSKSIKDGNKYLVYLKDIILGNNSQDYITIIIKNNITNIDYTNLLNYFDKSINKYIVEIDIEEKE